MSNVLKTLVKEYGWLHLSLGLFGNVSFFLGSILFLPSFEPYKKIGVWLFIIGAFFMMIGAIGRLLVDIWDNKGKESKNKNRSDRSTAYD